MDAIDAASAFLGMTSSERNMMQNSTAPSETHTITGTAVSDSENGVVRVDLGGYTISDDGEQSLELPTTVDVTEGDTVQVTLVGGIGKSPIVTGVVGGGDRLSGNVDTAVSTANAAASAVGSVSKYFFHDSAGAHVTTVAESPNTGMNSLWDNTDLHFRNGTTDVARFGASGSQLGKDDEAHLVMDANSMELYDENGTQYFFAGDRRSLDTGTVTVTDTIVLADYRTDTFQTVYPTDDVNTVALNGTVLTRGTDWDGWNLPGFETFTVVLTSMPSMGDMLEFTYDVTDQFLAYSLGGTATGMGSVAEGTSTASGKRSHAEGASSAAEGIGSHAEGSSTRVSGNAGHAEGNGTYSAGSSSHAEGDATTARGYASHTEGYGTTAVGYAAHAEGFNTAATSWYQHAGGKYNVGDALDTYAEIIGNGTASDARSNARTLDWNGNEELQGELYLGGCTANGETPYPATRYNTSGSNLEYYDGSAWQTISTGGSTQTGDLTYDTSTGDTKYWDGSAWKMATPAGLVYGGSIVKNVTATQEPLVFDNATVRSMFNVNSGDENKIGIQVCNGDYGAQGKRITSLSKRTAGWYAFLDSAAAAGAFRFNYIVFVPKAYSTV